jgi:hypothetical protein
MTLPNKADFEIDRMLKIFEGTRDAMRQGMFFIELMMDDPTRDFAWIENRLRAIHCDLLFLLALPNSIAPAHGIVKDPCGRYTPEFWTWHVVNGRAERNQEMRKRDLRGGDAVNLENLKMSGYVTLGVGETRH